jgi:hypothetical protein
MSADDGEANRRMTKTATGRNKAGAVSSFQL